MIDFFRDVLPEREHQAILTCLLSYKLNCATPRQLISNVRIYDALLLSYGCYFQLEYFHFIFPTNH